MLCTQAMCSARHAAGPIAETPTALVLPAIAAPATKRCRLHSATLPEHRSSLAASAIGTTGGLWDGRVVVCSSRSVVRALRRSRFALSLSPPTLSNRRHPSHHPHQVCLPLCAHRRDGRQARPQALPPALLLPQQAGACWRGWARQLHRRASSGTDAGGGLVSLLTYQNFHTPLHPRARTHTHAHTKWPTQTLTNTHTYAQRLPCPRGEQCPHAHNLFEYWLHPAR